MQTAKRSKSSPPRGKEGDSSNSDDSSKGEESGSDGLYVPSEDDERDEQAVTESTDARSESDAGPSMAKQQKTLSFKTKKQMKQSRKKNLVHRGEKHA
jgi:hypothetical protein